MNGNGRAHNAKQTISVREAAHILGLGNRSIYNAVSRGEIPSIRVGRRLLIPKKAIERLLEPGPRVPPPSPTDGQTALEGDSEHGS